MSKNFKIHISEGPKAVGRNGDNVSLTYRATPVDGDGEGDVFKDIFSMGRGALKEIVRVNPSTVKYDTLVGRLPEKCLVAVEDSCVVWKKAEIEKWKNALPAEEDVEKPDYMVHGIEGHRFQNGNFQVGAIWGVCDWGDGQWSWNLATSVTGSTELLKQYFTDNFTKDAVVAIIGPQEARPRKRKREEVPESSEEDDDDDDEDYEDEEESADESEESGASDDESEEEAKKPERKRAPAGSKKKKATRLASPFEVLKDFCVAVMTSGASCLAVKPPEHSQTRQIKDNFELLKDSVDNGHPLATVEQTLKLARYDELWVVATAESKDIDFYKGDIVNDAKMETISKSFTPGQFEKKKGPQQYLIVIEDIESENWRDSKTLKSRRAYPIYDMDYYLGAMGKLCGASQCVIIHPVVKTDKDDNIVPATFNLVEGFNTKLMHAASGFDWITIPDWIKIRPTYKYFSTGTFAQFNSLPDIGKGSWIAFEPEPERTPEEKEMAETDESRANDQELAEHYEPVNLPEKKHEHGWSIISRDLGNKGLDKDLNFKQAMPKVKGKFASMEQYEAACKLFGKSKNFQPLDEGEPVNGRNCYTNFDKVNLDRQEEKMQASFFRIGQVLEVKEGRDESDKTYVVESWVRFHDEQWAHAGLKFKEDGRIYLCDRVVKSSRTTVTVSHEDVVEVLDVRCIPPAALLNINDARKELFDSCFKSKYDYFTHPERFVAVDTRFKQAVPLRHLNEKRPPPPRLRGLELFAGCGGLSWGLDKSGLVQTKWAVEFMELPSQLFASNFKDTNVYRGDVWDVLDFAQRYGKEPKGSSCDWIEKVDVSSTEKKRKQKEFHRIAKELKLPQPGSKDAPQFISGGPPCQGFSGANRQKSEWDPKNSMCSVMLSIVEAYQSTVQGGLLENVHKIVQSGAGKAQESEDAAHRMVGGQPHGTMDHLSMSLMKMGFNVQWIIMNAAYFSVPQARDRAFLLFTRPGWSLGAPPKATSFYKGINTDVTRHLRGEILRKLIVRNQGRKAFRSVTSIRQAHDDLRSVAPGYHILHKGREKGKDGKKSSMDYFKEKEEKSRSKVEDTIGSDFLRAMNEEDKSVDRINGHCFVALYGEQDRFNQVLGWNEFRKQLAKRFELRMGPPSKIIPDHMCMRRESDADCLWKTKAAFGNHQFWRGLFGRVDPETVAPCTLACFTGMGKNGSQACFYGPARFMTCRELARTQSMDDSYQWLVENLSDLKKSIESIGNSVPPAVAYILGDWMSKSYNPEALEVERDNLPEMGDLIYYTESGEQSSKANELFALEIADTNAKAKDAAAKSGPKKGLKQPPKKKAKKGGEKKRWRRRRRDDSESDTSESEEEDSEEYSEESSGSSENSMQENESGSQERKKPATRRNGKSAPKHSGASGNSKRVDEVMAWLENASQEAIDEMVKHTPTEVMARLAWSTACACHGI